MSTHLQDNIRAAQTLLAGLAGLEPQVALAADAIATALLSGHKLLACGNGGSAADAQHLAAEFVVRFTVNRPALPSLALSVDTSALTAWANDFGYEQVFARQVEALGREGDVLVGLSTSGNSPNVVAALKTARERKLITIGMTGADGGKMAEFCDTLLRVPSRRTQNIQEAHGVFGHIIVQLMEQALFPEKFQS